MRVIGLTGGIASGKSTAASALSALGAPLLDADAVARRVVEPGMPAHARIREVFGDAVVRPDGTLDRAALGKLVFTDPARRRQLEAIVHPAVQTAMLDWLEARRAEGTPAAVVVIPLLVETGWQRLVDEVWVVDVPEEVQIQRLMARDGLPREEAEARLAAQAGRSERLAHATRVFPNDGSPDDLARRVAEAWRAVVKGS